MWNYFNSLPDNIKYLIIAFLAIIILLVATRIIWGEQLKKFSVSISEKGFNFNLETHVKNNTLAVYEIHPRTEIFKESKSNDYTAKSKSGLSIVEKRIFDLLASLDKEILLDGEFFGWLRDPYIGIPKPKSIKLLSKSPDIPLDFLVSFPNNPFFQSDIIQYWENVNGERIQRRHISHKLKFNKILVSIQEYPKITSESSAKSTLSLKDWEKTVLDKLGKISAWINRGTVVWVIILGYQKSSSLDTLIGKFRQFGILISTEKDLDNISNAIARYEQMKLKQQHEKHIEKTVKKISK